MYHQFKELAGVDITREPMEVGPTTHYIMGGVRVDADSQMTSVPGLFAAGECAAGLHGANRLGGNSLSDLLVFGKRAGEYAAKFAREQGNVTIDSAAAGRAAERAVTPFGQTSGANPYELQAELQETMQSLAGIVRTGSDLREAITKIRELQKNASRAACNGNRAYNPGWHLALELRHMLTVAEAIALAASEREESRGGHFREDFPSKSDDWGKVNLVIRKDGDAMTLSKIERTPLREDLREIIEQMK
ncbi:MAG: FAD-binding protein [Cyclobacteriaceae bacterium]|nr:FAD-binding protein [Cyclobacteriaceae bacterium]